MNQEFYSLQFQKKKKKKIFLYNFFSLDLQVTLQEKVDFLILEEHHKLYRLLRNPNSSHVKDKPIGASGNASKELATLKCLFFREYVLSTIILQDDSVAPWLIYKMLKC